MKNPISNVSYILCICLAAVIATACREQASIPSQYEMLKSEAAIYPDYTDIVIPPNIAPLNFMLRDTAAVHSVVCLRGTADSIVVAADRDGRVEIDTAQWRALLLASRGGDITVRVFSQHADGWVCYRPHRLTVAEEETDPYLSYRLIEPGYELYRQLGIYQRNLTNWDQHTIYENNREFDNRHNHCINCHNYRANDASDMLFHVRAEHGGTVIVQNGQARKVQIKDSTIVTAGVYPSWHPKDNLIAFSTNKTGQTFHLYHPEKIEVLDEASDLLLYDVSKNEVSHIIRTRDELETFPCWSPEGDCLYYCNARVGHLIDPAAPDSTRDRQLAYRYDSIHYNLMAVAFDRATRTFSRPYTVVDAVSKGKSVSVPRVSPDGRYVLYTQGDYGQFHVWHKSSDLWVKDLQADTCYALREANSYDADSFHSWSSNGRWIAFSSRRMDGNYTRIFMAYFDRDGRAHKAFVIPQEDPEMNILLLKSYNVPELTRNAVSIPASDLRRCIYTTDGDNARYTGMARQTAAE